MKIGGLNIEWLGHASFRILNSAVIYIDPFKIKSTEKADIILITHEHFDHCSPDDVKRIAGPKTVVLAPADCKSKLVGDVREIEPGDSVKLGDVVVEAVPAYNLDKNFHPRARKWVGYVVEIGGQRIYHAGDSDSIPEMQDIKVDVAMLPVGGTYTMNVREAAAAAEKINATYVIPMHYGSVVGDKGDGDKFKSLCRCEVLILPQSR
jgi:L-ascorbate metabolism protein UlaG (beta-lactamase superfamily)